MRKVLINLGASHPSGNFPHDLCWKSNCPAGKSPPISINSDHNWTYVFVSCPKLCYGRSSYPSIIWNHKCFGREGFDWPELSRPTLSSLRTVKVLAVRALTVTLVEISLFSCYRGWAYFHEIHHVRHDTKYYWCQISLYAQALPAKSRFP